MKGLDVDTIKIMKNNAAIDAAILTKDSAVLGLASEHYFSIDKVATIGDELVDLPMLNIDGLGLSGSPANAQEKVKTNMRGKSNYYLSEKSFFNGFLEFYKVCASKGIELVVSDRDGVLKEISLTEYASSFIEFAKTIGNEGLPHLAILTGSSYSQNVSFMKAYGLDDRLSYNSAINLMPNMLLLESGAIHVNVLTGKVNNYVSKINKHLLNSLKKEFEPLVRKKIETEILPRHNLAWSEDTRDQAGKMFHVKDKLSMVTFNVPQYFSDGKTKYRPSDDAMKLREEVCIVMENCAKDLSLPYRIF